MSQDSKAFGEGVRARADGKDNTVPGKYKGKPEEAEWLEGYNGAPADEKIKLVEVRLIRKYVPHHLYERNEQRSVAPDIEEVLDEKGRKKLIERNPGLLVVNPVIDGDGKLVVERMIVDGYNDDKFGRKVPQYRSSLTPYPPKTIIPLPVEEARRAIRLKIAEITENTVLG